MNAELPHQVELVYNAATADQTAKDARSAYYAATAADRRRASIGHAASGWRDVAAELGRLTEKTAAARSRLDTVEQRIGALTADPAITSQPDPEGFLSAAHTRWTGDYTLAQAEAVRQAQYKAGREAEQAAQQRMHNEELHHGPSYGPDTGRDGPSIGR